MRFTDIFIRRPVLATSLSLVILLLGLRAWMGMTVREFPRVINTTVTIETAYPGASAKTVQGFVTSTLQAAVARAPGIDYLTSTSAEGKSTITVHMKLDYSPNNALTQITSKVNEVRNELPSKSEAPVINETVGQHTDLMYLAFYSSMLSQQQINDYLLRVAQPLVQGVKGVGQAQILPSGVGLGGNKFAMRVWLNPDRMAALNVTPADVVQALQSNSYVSAVGRAKSKNKEVGLVATTVLHSAPQFRQLVVRHTGNTLVHLGEVARVQLGAERYDQAVFFDGKPATFIGVRPAPDANSLSVARGVHKVMDRLQAKLPPGLHLATPYDASIYIQQSINDVLTTVAITLVVVVLVIFLFLGSLRSLLIPAVAIPLSIIGGGLIMEVFGFSINLLTLLAVVLAIGLVVDDAIIVVENIHRHIELGESRFDAAVNGARELAAPIIVMSTTLAAVFAPIGFEGGLTGSLFTQFAFTLVAAVVVSMVVALTLSPMLSSKALRPTKGHGLAHFLDETFSRLREVYDRSLHKVLDYRPVALMFALAILVAIPFMFQDTSSALAPTEDQGLVLMSGTAPPTATINYLNRYGRQVRDIFKSYPQAQTTFQINGLTLNGGGTNGMVGGMTLVPWSQRAKTQTQVLNAAQGKLSQITGMQAVAFAKPSLPGSSGGLPVQFVVTSSGGYKQLDKVAGELIGKGMHSGLFGFLKKNLRFDKPQTVVQIHRAIAADLGLSMRDIGQNLAPLLSGNYINYFNMSGRSYRVIPQLPIRFRSRPQSLLHDYVRAHSGRLVPLSTVLSLRNQVEPEFLPQFQQLNAATIQGTLAPGVTLGQALDYLRTTAHKLFPSGFGVNYASQSRQFMRQGHTMMVTFALAIVLVYLLLAAQFESFRDPWVVLITVPMSIWGALVFLFLGFTTLNIYTEVGMVALIGLITKQGILIVQFANSAQENDGLDVRAAVQRASSIRLRPILMTTAAMVFGAMPLVFAGGAGASSRFAMGLVIVTGLSVGALFSLYIVPVIYSYLSPQRATQGQDDGEAQQGGEQTA